jgi:hypothetical protein
VLVRGVSCWLLHCSAQVAGNGSLFGCKSPGAANSTQHYLIFTPPPPRIARREVFTAKKLEEVHAEAEAELGMVTAARIADLPALPVQVRAAALRFPLGGNSIQPPT